MKKIKLTKEPVDEAQALHNAEERGRQEGEKRIIDLLKTIKKRKTT